MKHELAKLADIPGQGSKLVSFFGRDVHVYMAGGEPRAVSNTCLHIGGPLDCKEGQFVCPWHGARFDMASGKRLSGPAPGSSRLMFLPTKVEDGSLYYVWAD